MKKNDKKTILIIIIISTLFVAVASASYAYFMARIESTGTSKAEVKTSTLDSLVYSTGANLEIIANQDTFAIGKGNLVKQTESDVTLQVNNMTSAEYCYNVNLKVDDNTFSYTSGTTPELIITVLKNGNSVFTGDITTKKNNVIIASKQKISGNPNEKITDNWKTTLTMINLDSLQNENTGKSFLGNLEFITVEC